MSSVTIMQESQQSTIAEESHWCHWLAPRLTPEEIIALPGNLQILVGGDGYWSKEALSQVYVEGSLPCPMGCAKRFSSYKNAAAHLDEVGIHSLSICGQKFAQMQCSFAQYLGVSCDARIKTKHHRSKHYSLHELHGHGIPSVCGLRFADPCIAYRHFFYTTADRHCSPCSGATVSAYEAYTRHFPALKDKTGDSAQYGFSLVTHDDVNESSPFMSLASNLPMTPTKPLLSFFRHSDHVLSADSLSRSSMNASELVNEYKQLTGDTRDVLFCFSRNLKSRTFPTAYIPEGWAPLYASYIELNRDIGGQNVTGYHRGLTMTASLVTLLERYDDGEAVIVYQSDAFGCSRALIGAFCAVTIHKRHRHAILFRWDEFEGTLNYELDAWKAAAVESDTLTFQDDISFWVSLWSDKMARVAAGREHDLVCDGVFRVLGRIQLGKDAGLPGRRTLKKKQGTAEDRAFVLQQKRFGTAMQGPLRDFMG